MPLTDVLIKNAKPPAKTQRLFDAKGLYLELTPRGGKWWRLKYRFAGKEKRLSLGTYPDVPLKKARALAEDARALLRDSIDPSAARKKEKILAIEKQVSTFRYVADQWLSKYRVNWTSGHAERVQRRLELNIFPKLGSLPIDEVTPQVLLAVVRNIEARGALDTAHRALQDCGKIFRYAVATGLVPRDITYDLRGALPPVRSKHHASIIEPKKVGNLLRSLDAYEGSDVVKAALRLAPLVFVRPGELRQAKWDEIDFDLAEWRIPAEKMKMRVPHIVPLSRQALSILEWLRPVTSKRASGLVFPSARGQGRPISENTVNIALRSMGYSKEEMTGHGFRSMASTLLHELGWNSDLIERQLAHGEKNKVKASYNFAQYLQERREMMQGWADYLDSLKSGADILPFKRFA